MEKILLLLFLLNSLNSSAQVFWTEDFGTGCDQGMLASTYNFWQISFTGPQDSLHDDPYISAMANNNDIGNCADDCSGGTNRSLHIGISTGYLSNDIGPGYSLDNYATSNIRTATPNIDFTGRYNVEMSFIYFENGEGADDDASLWGYDGNNWILIDPLPKTTTCGSGSGIWTLYSVMLPPGFDNVWNVRLGFLWVNDNDGFGDFPSFAVDDIVLTAGLSTSIQNVGSENSFSLYPNPFTNELTIKLNEDAGKKEIFLFDVTGKEILRQQTAEAEIKLNTENIGAGLYLLKVGGENFKVVKGQ